MSKMSEFNNCTFWIEENRDGFQLSYRITATVLHTLIFVIGFIGNVGIMVVVYKSKVLHTPGYAYLVSLASADLIVIAIAVPEAIVSHQIGRLWALGKFGCAIFVFLNFFGINAGSLSLMAFTVERYVAVCRPLLAQKICTLDRTRKIILLCWVIAFLYCAPWLGLTEVRQDPISLDLEQCELRLSREIYEAIFAMDLFLFYLVPLMLAVICHAKIGKVLKKRARRFSLGHMLNKQHTYNTKILGLERQEHFEHQVVIYKRNSHQNPALTLREQTQRLRMLVVIVVMFAGCWLPFRGLLLYNTFQQEPWLDLWYMLFAKSLIYVNCAINPFLYTVLCHRFRAAVKHLISRK